VPFSFASLPGVTVSKRAVRVVVAALALASLAASGCVPSRDNPHDPANAPAARLTLVNATTGVTGDLHAPWAHAIAFDAMASTDSQNNIDHCVFVVETTSGNPAGEPWKTDCYGELHAELNGDPLDSPFGVPGALSLSSSYHVRVTVVDEDGNVGTAPPPGIENRRKFRLTNEEPVADPGINRVLPRAGLPWNPTQPIALTFNGEKSDDADGEEDLTYCWTLNVAGSPSTENCSLNPIASVNVDPASYPGNSLTAQLRVRDGLGAFSRTRVARVAFQSLNIWVMPQGTGSLERLDSLHRTSVYGESNAAIAATEIPASGQIVIIGDVEGDFEDGDIRDNTMHVVVPPLGPKASSPPAAGIDLAGTGLARLASDPRPLERRVWLRTSHAPSASPDFAQIDLDNCNTDCSYLSSYIVDANGAVTAERLADIPLRFSENGDRDGGRLFVDELGRVFVANGLSAQVMVLDTDGTLTENLLGDAVTPSVVVSAISPRPGTTETWIVLSHVLDPAASTQPAELFIFEGAEQRHTAEIVDEAIPFGIGWIDRNEFWVGRPGPGMSRVNAETVADQAITGIVFLDQAVVQTAPEIIDVGTMLADRISGDVWLSGLSGLLARVSPSGEVTSYDVDSEGTQPLFVDAVGALWHSPRGTLSQAFAPSKNGVAEDLGIRHGNMVEYDWETGGVWFPKAVPPGIVHAADDGTLLRYENRITINGVDQFLPLTQLFRLTPGTTTGYYAGINPFVASLFGPVYRIEDITQSPMVFTEILTAVEAEDIDGSGSVFEPFAPIPSSPSHLWTVMSGEVRLLDSAGNSAGVTFPLTAPEVGEPIRAARALETNDLCFATETATSEVRVRRITPSGIVTTHATFTLIGGSQNDLLVAVAATVDPVEGPLCWIGWKRYVPGETAHIRAFAADGSTVAAYDSNVAALPLGEQMVSILPISTSEVWATFARRDSATGSFDRPIWKSVLVMTSTTTLLPALTLEPTSAAQLVAPWTRGEQRGTFD